MRSAWLLALLRATSAPLAVGCAATLLAFASPAAAAINVTTTVDELADPGPGTGCSLREAIQAVNTTANFGGCVYDEPVIELPAGVYELEIDGSAEEVNATGDLDITALQLTINGTGDPSIRANTLVEPDRVMHVHLGSVLILSGLNISMGHADLATDGDGRGGGILNEGTLQATSVDIAYNLSTSGLGGGGIASDGTLKLDACNVYQNESESTSFVTGGGIMVQYGTAQLTDTTVADNTITGTDSWGGGISAWPDTLVSAAESTISGNTAVNGAGITAYLAELLLTDSTVSDSAGDGIYVGFGFSTIERSTISGNDDDGIEQNETDSRINNSTISGNVAAGIAVFGYYGVSISHATITQNAVGLDGSGAIFVKSSIVTGNAAQCAGTDISSGSQNVFGNASDCPLTGSDFETSSAPIDATLTDNGGTTLTHALVADSSAIDHASDCLGVSGPVSLDQTSATRPFGATCDSGALEDQTQRGAGEGCQVGPQCVNGNCVDGICCNDSVCGDCQSCNVSGLEGNCEPDATELGDACGDQSATDCTAPNTCNASGACLDNDQADGTACSNGECATGVCVDQGAGGAAGAGAGGEAGATGEAGAEGEGGAGGGAGGSSGSSGSATGGSSGSSGSATGGSSGSSGSSGMGGSANGGNATAGSATGGSAAGGSATGGSATGGSSANAGAGAEPWVSSSSSDDGGCGCTVPGQEPAQQKGLWALALAAIGLIGRRRPVRAQRGGRK